MKAGDVTVRHNDKMIAIRCGRCLVAMLSTVDNKHVATTDKRSVKNKIKPKSVMNYNVNIDAGDKLGMIIFYKNMTRKTTK